jgi:hypothetical protein
MRPLARTARAAAFALAAIAAVQAAPARAAPQIVAAVPTNGPVELLCDGAQCWAEFSTICLQQARFTPKAGTGYVLHDKGRAAVAVTGVTGDGAIVDLDPGLLRYAALRGQVSFRFALPADVLAREGLASVSVTLRRLVTLVPRGQAGDPLPQTPDDVSVAVREIATTGGYWAAINTESIALARMTNRVINRLPSEGSVSPAEGAALWKRAAAHEPDLAAKSATRGGDLIDHCQRRSARPGSVSMRRCLGYIHDQYMHDLNFKYWNTLKPQS